MSRNAQYIPALRFNFLTPLYDPLLRWVMREVSFKRRLIEQARLAPESLVLDLGCGTGTLTILVKEMHPDVQVIGVDGDERALAIARAKAARRAVNIEFDWGMAQRLSYAKNSFDRVLSSLMMHHLTTEDKVRALKEAHRVLRPGGQLLIIDFGKPHNRWAWMISRVTRRLERTADLIQGVLPDLIRRAGFCDVQIAAQFMSVFGTLTLYRGGKPEV